MAAVEGDGADGVGIVVHIEPAVAVDGDGNGADLVVSEFPDNRGIGTARAVADSQRAGGNRVAKSGNINASGSSGFNSWRPFSVKSA